MSTVHSHVFVCKKKVTPDVYQQAITMDNTNVIFVTKCNVTYNVNGNATIMFINDGTN